MGPTWGPIRVTWTLLSGYLLNIVEEHCYIDKTWHISIRSNTSLFCSIKEDIGHKMLIWLFIMSLFRDPINLSNATTKSNPPDKLSNGHIDLTYGWGLLRCLPNFAGNGKLWILISRLVIRDWWRQAFAQTFQELTLKHWYEQTNVHTTFYKMDKTDWFKLNIIFRIGS